MEKGMKNMTAVLHTIEKVIHSSEKAPSKEKAKMVLRDCGILDGKGNVKAAYKSILVTSSKDKNANK